jgi:hypothetical protein
MMPSLGFLIPPIVLLLMFMFPFSVAPIVILFGLSAFLYTTKYMDYAHLPLMLAIVILLLKILSII